MFVYTTNLPCIMHYISLLMYIVYVPTTVYFIIITIGILMGRFITVGIIGLFRLSREYE